MRKFYASIIARGFFFLLLLTILSSRAADAQSITIEGTGTSSSYLYSPVYSYNAAPRSLRIAYIYSQSLLSGMPAGSMISKLQFSRNAASGTLPAGNNLKLYLANIASSDWGSSDLTWDIAAATLVFDGDPSAIIGSSAGYKEFNLSASFEYTGGNLAIFSAYSQVNAPADNITWNYNTSATQPGYSANQTKYTSSASATMPAILTSSSANHPNIKIDYMPAGPCSSPPAPGNAMALPAIPVCAGTGVALNITGNSAGSGQSYIWQAASSLAGPFTDLSAGSTNPGFTVTPASTTYYRAAVTCSGNTAYSVPVEVMVNPALPAGTYTINPGLPAGSGNYQSLTSAIDALSCGIAGPVIFDVAIGSGPYNEQITIPQVAGASAVNTISFIGNGATIQATPVSAARSLILLDGADYITIKKFNLLTQGATYGWGIHLTNDADHNTIDSCFIDISSVTSTTQSNSAGIVVSGSATSVTTDGSASYNIISNNSITGGYQGIIISGTATSANAVSNTISNNTIQDFYADGISLTDNDGAFISGNNISRANRTAVTTFTGIELGAGNINSVINANRIHDTHNAASSQSGAAYGIYLNSCDAAAGAENRITNNLVYNFNSATGTIYGLYNTGSDGAYFYHNTVVLDNGSATAGITRGFYQSTEAAGIDARNNIFYITRGGTGAKHCVYFGTTTSTIASNKNILYLNSPAGTNGIGSFGTTNFTTLADWQTANSNVYDQQSLGVDPLFLNPGAGDYTPGEPAINNAGDNVGITADILGNARTVSNPDPGAYEFSLGSCSNPPLPGTATTTKAIVCSGESFTLSLLNNSIGDGQTYQWQVSPDNNTWTNTGTAATITSFITSQTVTAYYRAAVQCSGGTIAYSTSVLVTTPGLVAGVFSINNAILTGGTNFQTFNDAVTYIKCGINGPVVFNVAPNSSYNEQVILPSIAGTSAVNTITFYGNGAILSFLSVSSSERATFKLQGTDYVTIDSLQIMAIGSQSSEYGFAVQLADDADNNTIRKSTLSATLTPTTASSSNFAGVVINAGSAASPVATGNSLCDNNTISGNRITGGYVGISIVADGNTSTVSGNKIINNSVQDFYTYGIYADGNDGTLIEGNDISRPTRNSVTIFYGINLNDININTRISGNRIHNPFDGNTASTSAAYGVRLINCDATAGNENMVSNNMIYGFMGGSGTQNAIINNSSDHARFYFNSILLDDQGASCNCITRGIYVQSAAVAGLDFRNNNIAVGRGGTGAKQALYLEPASVSGYTINNNNYYLFASGGTQEIIHMGTSGYTTLAAWQAASGTDANSLNTDPLFVSPADLHLQGSSTLDDKGTSVSGITTDIDGETRDGGTPDIGADELALATGLDIKPSVLVSPAITTGCYGTETITVRIKNNSTGAINFITNPVTVTVAITGVATATFTAIVNTGSLASGATQDVTMTSPAATFPMTAAGAYIFNISTAATGDVNTSNNTLPAEARTKTTLTAGVVTVSPDSYCVTGAEPTLSVAGADGYSVIQWQQSTTPGTGFSTIPGAITSPYTVSGAITQTMYYRLLATCGAASEIAAEASVTLNDPQVTATSPATRCGTGTVTLGATGSAGTTLNWYAAATGGAPLTTGPSYSPGVSSTTTYYVSASIGGTAENMPSPTAGTSLFHSNATGWGLRFTANQRVTINSVVMYPVNSTAGAASLQVKITDLADAVLYTGTLHNFTVGTAIAPVTVPVDITVPPGDYKMVMVSTGINNLVRESGGVTFPYTALSNAVSITAGANGTGTSQTTSAYYWFYNWQVSTGCEGPRVPVTATVSAPPALTATATGAMICAGEGTDITVTSPNDPGYTYTWTPGNLTGATQSVTPATTTVYTVDAIDNSGGANNGCVNSTTVTVTVNPLPAAVTINPAATTVCTGGAASLLTAGGGAVSGAIALSEDFNGTAAGWTTDNTSTGGTIAAADWTLRPDGYVYGSTPVTFHSNDNSQFYLTNSDAQGSGGTTSTVLQSPVFSLAGYTTANLGFWHYYRTASAPESINIEISVNGTSWTTLQTYTTAQGGSAAFANVNINLDAYAGQSTVSLRFSYKAGFDWYWAIDNLLVTGNQSAAITWSPIAGLFTDAAGNVPYTGTATTTVYANPAIATVYTATASNSFGCTSSGTATVTLNQPAIINTQPAAQAVCPGTDVIFSVVAINALSYQWQKDGIDINGATGSTYAIDNADPGDVGTYTVTVIGNCANTNSNPAALTLSIPTTITVQPASQGVCTGATVVFNVTADGTGLAYQWRKGGVNINGAVSSSYTINAAVAGDAGSYDVVVTGDCGTETSVAANLSLDGITVSAPPAAQAICEGEPVTFSVTAAGTGLTYQWRKDGTDISGAIASSYTINATAIGDAGDYDVVITGGCGTQISAAATLTINSLTAITVQPVSQAVCPGDNLSMSVTATGAGVLTYQWRKSGADIQGATGSTYTIDPVVSGDAGSYDVIVTGDCGAVTSAAVTLTVNTVTAIVIPPVAQTVCTGEDVTFDVTATGTDLSYQWRKDNIDIGGATSPAYTITGVTAADAGSYDVVVTGTCGTATAVAVLLAINEVTTITTAPLPQEICDGADAVFSVLATGTNLTYQWKKDGNDISGASSAVYTITGATATDAGDYEVVVSGDCGNQTSAAVSLTVNPAGTWTGLTSSDWNTAGNWCGSMPTPATDVLIPASAPNMPDLSGAGGTARNIIISTGATLTIGTNGTLDLYGDIVNNGVFNATAGSISFSGNNSQAIPAFTATDITMNGNGGIVLGGNAVVNGTLTLTNGHITLGSNTITLAAGSAGSITSHIITNGTGHVITANLAASSTRTIPVGINAASYNPVVLAANATHTTDNFTVRVQEAVYENGVSGSTFNEYVVDRTWLINEEEAGGSNVNITLQWTGDQELSRFERHRSYVMQHNGSMWVTATETPADGNDPYTQTKNGVTSFSALAVQKQPIPDAPLGIYPNPVSSILNVVVRPRQAEQMVLTVYDAAGKLMSVQKESVVSGANLLQIDVSKLAAGMYTLKVSTPGDKEFMVRKFLKVN